MAILNKKEIQNFIRQYSKKNDTMQIDKLILVAITSAAGGALLGMLFAPDKGTNTRKKMAKKRDKYLKQIKKSTEELSQQLKNETDTIFGKFKNRLQNFKHEVEDYSELTYQELYDMAKELKIKGYSQMKKSELIQALDN